MRWKLQEGAPLSCGAPVANERAQAQGNRYPVVLNGHPAAKNIAVALNSMQKTNQNRQSVASNGNPVARRVPEPDFHFVINVTSEGRPSSTMITRLDVFPLSLSGSTLIQSMQTPVASSVALGQALLSGTTEDAGELGSGTCDPGAEVPLTGRSLGIREGRTRIRGQLSQDSGKTQYVANIRSAPRAVPDEEHCHMVIATFHLPDEAIEANDKSRNSWENFVQINKGAELNLGRQWPPCHLRW